MGEDPDATLVRLVVDVQKAVAEFREASERRHDTSSQAYRHDKNVPNRSLVQKRLSIYNWNPGPRRGKEDAFEKQIASKWHVITLQEAIEYVDHDMLTNRFHVTHYGGCAILFNKDTFYPNTDVQSLYLHDTRRDLPDQMMEGDQVWASFRRPPLVGQKTFTVLSLHVNNIYAKKPSLAKKLILTIRAIMIGQHIDLVAGDFFGTAWRCSNRDNISTIDEAFADCALPTPPGPAPLWGPGPIPNNWADVCGFLKPRNSDRYWKVRMQTLGLRPTDQSCHHATWLHLEFVDWRSTQSHHEEHDRRILLEERPAACPYGQQKRRNSEVMSDHSLSS